MMERTGWAAAVNTQYKMRGGQLAVITEYRVYYAAPGSDKATFRHAGINEVIEGHLAADPAQAIEWDANGICVAADKPQDGSHGADYDLAEAIRGGSK